MNVQLKPFLKTACAVAFIGVTAVLVIQRVRAFAHSGKEDTRVWFYDQSEKRLYATPNDAIPPQRGIGGTSGDGVRAVVVTFRGLEQNPDARRVAYLETFAPPLKQILEDVQKARAAHKPYQGTIPGLESDFRQTNTLVRRSEDPTWHPISSEEGQAIMSEWRSWRGPNGQPPLVCVP